MLEVEVLCLQQDMRGGNWPCRVVTIGKILSKRAVVARILDYQLIYYELIFGIKLVPVLMDSPFAGLHLTLAVNFVATLLGVVSLHRGCMTAAQS